jgi:hypothetical protein
MDKQQAKNKKIARRPVNRAISYQATFSTTDGEKVLFDLMKEHYVTGSTFSKCPQEMALREGERNVVLRILTIMKINVDDLAKKIEEGLNRQSDESF